MSAKSAKSASSENRITRADLRAASASTALATLPAGFVDTPSFVLPEGAVVKSMSPMLKPLNFPVGKVLIGKFAKIFKTSPGKGDDGKDKVGCGVEIIPAGANMGVALPVVATLAQGLEIDDVQKGEAAKSPFLGRFVAIQKMEAKLPSKKGQDAWHFVVAILPENYSV